MYLVKPGIIVYTLRPVQQWELFDQEDNRPFEGDGGEACPAYSPAFVISIDNAKMEAVIRIVNPNLLARVAYAAISPGAVPSANGWFANAQEALDDLRQLEINMSPHNAYQPKIAEIRRNLQQLLNLQARDPFQYQPGMQVEAACDITMAMLKSGESRENDDGTVWVPEGVQGRVIDRRDPQIRVEFETPGGHPDLDDGRYWVQPKWIKPFPYADGLCVKSLVTLKLHPPSGEGWIKIEVGDGGMLEYFPSEDDQPLHITWDKGAVNDCAYEEIEVLKD